TINQLEKLHGVHKGLIMGDSADLDRMQEELTAKYPDLTFVRSAENLLEIVLKGVSKASAVKIVAQEYGVDLQNCIAFGDNYNDEDMLEEVGYPFLMGNAPAELKQKFAPEQITADNNHDGVAKALAKIE
ncbi:MAG: HAD-IIB family hydrolase, partial [Lactobacillus crispatus]|nr:HAD-IIB family hydrolase [Lactobacillus crispatus]